MPTIHSCSLIERCLALGHDAPPSPRCVVASPGPPSPALAGRALTRSAPCLICALGYPRPHHWGLLSSSVYRRGGDDAGRGGGGVRPRPAAPPGGGAGSAARPPHHPHSPAPPPPP